MDRQQKLFAYELLFRHSTDNTYFNLDEDQATADVIINSFLLIGLERLTGGKKAFVNFTTNLLIKQTAAVLPKDKLVIEILENIEPDQEIILACQKLKKAGYVLALDDFVFNPKYKPLIELVDIIKIDIRNVDIHHINVIKNLVKADHIRFLAEKIETYEEFNRALAAGYSYFQGYYFSKPNIITGQDIQANKYNYLQLLQELNKPEIEMDKIENIIKQDISLSYKLLKFLNSAMFRFNSPINSIKQALTLLGQGEIKKWATIMVLKCMGENKPSELITSSLVRAKFGESIAYLIGLQHQTQQVFLIGMLSLLDALLDRPLDEILEEIFVLEEIKNALLGFSDTILRDILELTVAYEKGDWDAFSEYALKLKINEDDVPDLYIKALDAVNQAMLYSN